MEDCEREAMILGIQSMREPSPIQYTAPGAEKKWRARDLVDIRWKLVGEDPPSESHNRILSCIGHANPDNGRCQVKQKLIAAETGYSIDTVKRVAAWWEAKGFLVKVPSDSPHRVET
jgi:DNA-binding MarR family transcriptional regulator